MADSFVASTSNAPRLPRARSRANLVRRVILFQFKLMADGFRDVVMSPLSLMAGALGLLSSRDPEGYFDRLMHFGRQTDYGINLFDLYDSEDARRAATLDRVADEIETAVKRDFANGGVSAKSADALRGLAARLRRKGDRA